jgi:hypothetical protein
MKNIISIVILIILCFPAISHSRDCYSFERKKNVYDKSGNIEDTFVSNKFKYTVKKSTVPKRCLNLSTDYVAYEMKMSHIYLKFIFNKRTKNVVYIISKLGKLIEVPKNTPVTEFLDSSLPNIAHIFPVRTPKKLRVEYSLTDVEQKFEKIGENDLYVVSIQHYDQIDGKRRYDNTKVIGKFYFHPDEYWYYKYELFCNDYLVEFFEFSEPEDLDVHVVE